MVVPHEYKELVEQALEGNKDALPKLVEIIHESLRSYIFRITLSEDLADDILQETILEMYKIFGQLRRSDHFWSWLCKIALNKIRSNSRMQTRRKRLLQKHAEELSRKPLNLEGLASLINGEIKQAIFHAMSKLTERQKAVLSLRCYDDMPYSQIADVIGVSELNSRLLFYRAKKKLQKQLFKSGFGRKSILAALIIFGKMTAPNEAAAAQICVTSSTLGVGALATTIAVATTKTALTLSAGGVITLGLIAAGTSLDNSKDTLKPHQPTNAVVQNNSITSEDTDIEGYYYYPRGSNGPVMMRLSISTEKASYQVLQNDNGNYFLENMGQKVRINNHHYWNPNLSVMILPTDSPELAMFLGNFENQQSNSRMNFSTTRDLLIAASKRKGTNNITFSVQHYDALMEERFQYNWPADSTVIDNRDSIHQQGWCYFTMKGTFKGREISGLGQIPFKYPASQTRPAWFALKIDGIIKLFDSGKNAVMNNANGSIVSYPAQTFLTGLNKSWMGLHCIDTVRRDAALSKIPFKTEMLADEALCKVSLLHPKGTIEYTIDLYKDLIEKISFLDESGNPCGDIILNYSVTAPTNLELFKKPALKKYSGSIKRERIHWLAELVAGNL
ncbi:MAG: sigma-70 family RNA polymerase sigma factor [Phycisphaerae bacterium]|nr:RNA polymerase sigma factor [Phycisphaerae bacterium]NIR62808.1 RNA polymerase sigma factor [candidate division Zixibacteria bacterium]NIP52698.1 RNA polymerase sigma factor [Phycisphaerae bacterium]NIS51745.1 RNA polymerase sigma factor [Phycisphaerae bacterium]NIU56986.1 sigma-70 family RNA polymerase sigma factor [Phycisphaerae bacterium]